MHGCIDEWIYWWGGTCSIIHLVLVWCGGGGVVGRWSGVVGWCGVVVWCGGVVVWWWWLWEKWGKRVRCGEWYSGGVMW